MQPLKPEDLMSLETYARQRADFRRQAIAHKRRRTVHLGPHLTLLFEDRLTVQYQIQEMLRIERIFEPEGIADELSAYNPLIPDGSNWKATLLIEFPGVAERRRRLVEWRGIEHCFMVQVGSLPAVPGIADEDMERSNDEKTAAVHFLRFELTPPMRAAVREGADVVFGVEHPRCCVHTALTPEQRSALAADLD
ncbi:Protein of unknown function [Fontimonas thermophila]|uniref:DUF3501 domain-containing protein n=1 Tax=Fontimonas thermophila TaxID=1076937 RepID=A0A1I2I9G9_9GAMM|nr:DUF3501 family protein [Fontimonas thermophila]SFF38308.1 Protein of unknown function [Fontimonas thermophila]